MLDMLSYIKCFKILLFYHFTVVIRKFKITSVPYITFLLNSAALENK